MKSPLFRAALVVKKSPIHGYGVFADQDIEAGDTIEECYAFLLDKQDLSLANYYFKVGDKHAVALGYGFIYNHSDTANADYYFDPEYSLVVFKANQWIKKDKEILISYGKNWFSDRQMQQKKPPFLFRLCKNLLPMTTMLARVSILISAYFIFMAVVKKI